MDEGSGVPVIAMEEPAPARADAAVGAVPARLDWVGPAAFTTEECPVCFEVLGGDCPSRRLACGHHFHHACINRWLIQKAHCPICKADVPAPSTPATFKVDLGHQEMASIMTELEDIFIAIHACAGPDHRIALHGLGYNLCVSLGYEDEDELEEAIGGSLADFLGALPHFQVYWPEDPAADNAFIRCTMMPEPEEDLTGPGVRVVFTVSQREDLWRVVLQGPHALVEIPELEFAIRPRDRRRVDSIYNMIGSAVFHLGDHVSKNSRAGAISDEMVASICDTMEQLNKLLDLEQPFTVVVSDPQGISELKPSVGAHVGQYVQEGAGGGVAEVPEAAPGVEATPEAKQL